MAVSHGYLDWMGSPVDVNCHSRLASPPLEPLNNIKPTLWSTVDVKVLVSTSNTYENITSLPDGYLVQYLCSMLMVNPIRMVQLKKWSRLPSPLMTILNG